MAVEQLELLSIFVGWSYLMAWNITTYPLIIDFYNKKSTKGFSLDFGLMNVMCHLYYSMYTIGGFVYPGLGTGLVQINDVLFPTHCFLAGSVVLAQGFIYERGTKKVFSDWVLVVLALQWLVILTVFQFEAIFGFQLPVSYNTFKVAGY